LLWGNAPHPPCLTIPTLRVRSRVAALPKEPLQYPVPPVPQGRTTHSGWARLCIMALCSRAARPLPPLTVKSVGIPSQSVEGNPPTSRSFPGTWVKKMTRNAAGGGFQAERAAAHKCSRLCTCPYLPKYTVASLASCVGRYRLGKGKRVGDLRARDRRLRSRSRFSFWAGSSFSGSTVLGLSFSFSFSDLGESAEASSWMALR
jgi:hypothetical protein